MSKFIQDRVAKQAAKLDKLLARLDEAREQSASLQGALWAAERDSKSACPYEAEYAVRSASQLRQQLRAAWRRQASLSQQVDRLSGVAA